MAKEREKTHNRAPGMTQISISLPERLVEKIDRLAGLDKRSRSNFISYILDNLPEQQVTFSKTNENKAPLSKVG